MITTDDNSPQAREPAAELAWVVSPWRTNWRRPAAALAVCIITAIVAGITFTYPNYPDDYTPDTAGQTAAGAESTAVETPAEAAPADTIGAAAKLEAHRANWGWQALSWGLISLLLLLGMTASLYLPGRCKLDRRGVTTHFLGVPTFRPWQHYRNFYVHDNGIHLTTMPKPSALDPFRGHFVQFAGNRDEVVAFVKAHMVLRGVPEGQEPPQP